MPLITILLISCLFSAFMTCGLGVFVLAKNSSSAVSRLFFVSMLAATYWALGEFLIWYPGGYDNVRFWLKVSSFWPLVIALAVHFILTLTDNPMVKEKKSRIFLIALYAPAILFALIEIGTDTIYTVKFQPGVGFVYLPVQRSLVFVAELAYILVIMLWAAYASYSSWKSVGPGKLRRQGELVTASLGSVIGFGILSGVVLPAYGIYLPNLVFIGVVIFSLLIAYAVLRYGLFALNPETAVPYILRLMPDGLVLADMDGRIITTNASAAAIFRAGEADLPGRSLKAFIPEPAASSISTAIREQGTFLDIEVILDRKDYEAVSIAGSLVKDPEGEPAGQVLIVRDITNRKKSENALLLANEKISLLTRLNRHDISNLVTALWTYLELIKETRLDPVCESYIASSIGIVRRITSLLQFSRQFQDLGTFQPFWQPLVPMFSRAESDLPHEGIGITTRVAPIEIFADPLFVKAVYNILENAIRHGEHLTRIDVSAREQAGGELVVIIEDNGVGIPEGDKDRIFGYGFGKNTGLGLTLSREILSLTGITIRETGTPGKGARFEITVPREAWRPAADGDRDEQA